MDGHGSRNELTVAERRSLDWVAAMRWLDRRGAPRANSLAERLALWDRTRDTPLSS